MTNKSGMTLHRKYWHCSTERVESHDEGFGVGVGERMAMGSDGKFLPHLRRLPKYIRCDLQRCVGTGDTMPTGGWSCWWALLRRIYLLSSNRLSTRHRRARWV